MSLLRTFVEHSRKFWVTTFLTRHAFRDAFPSDWAVLIFKITSNTVGPCLRLAPPFFKLGRPTHAASPFALFFGRSLYSPSAGVC